jgi:hypothetical protein
MADKYSGNPNLAYIVIGGLGRFKDETATYLILGSDSTSGADFTALTAIAVSAGYDSIASAWVDGALNILGLYNRLFPTITIVADLYYPVPLNVPVKDGLAALNEYVAAANQANGSNRFAYMDELLTASTDGSNPIDFLVTSQAPHQAMLRTSFESSDSTDFQTTMDNGVALAPTAIGILDADAEKAGDYPAIIRATADSLRNLRRK